MCCCCCCHVECECYDVSDEWEEIQDVPGSGIMDAPRHVTSTTSTTSNSANTTTTSTFSSLSLLTSNHLKHRAVVVSSPNHQKSSSGTASSAPGGSSSTSKLLRPGGASVLNAVMSAGLARPTAAPKTLACFQSAMTSSSFVEQTMDVHMHGRR